MKKSEIDANRSILFNDLMHSGKYGKRVEVSKKAYKRKAKHSKKGDGYSSFKM